MQEADRTRFAGVMAKLGVVYMREIDDPLIGIYWDHLKGYDIVRIEKACELAVDMLTNFPRVAEIIKHLPKVEIANRIPETTQLTENEKVWVKYQWGFLAYIFRSGLMKEGVLDVRKKRTELFVDYLQKRKGGYKTPRVPGVKQSRASNPNIPTEEEISLIEIELHEIQRL